jgi:hypothetical protein
MTLSLLILALACFTCSCFTIVQVRSIDRKEVLTTVVSDTGGFDVLLNGRLWFRSRGKAFVRSGGQLYSTEDKSLILQNVTKYEFRTDNGVMLSYVLDYAAADGVVLMQGIVELNEEANIIFKQFFPQALENTATEGNNPDSLISGFPVFEIEEKDHSRGYAHWVSWFYDEPEATTRQRKLLVAPGFTSPRFGEWANDTVLSGGAGGSGVICVFDRDTSEAGVLSALESPMAMSHISPSPGELQYGVMGGVIHVPEGFVASVVLAVSGHGINCKSKILQIFFPPALS